MSCWNSCRKAHLLAFHWTLMVAYKFLKWKNMLGSGCTHLCFFFNHQKSHYHMKKQINYGTRVPFHSLEGVAKCKLGYTRPPNQIFHKQMGNSQSFLLLIFMWPVYLKWQFCVFLLSLYKNVDEIEFKDSFCLIAQNKINR